MARNKILNQELRAKSILKIREAAMHCFSEHGFDGTTISMIVKRAEVSKGLIYNYFDSKEALLEAVVVDIIGKLSVPEEAIDYDEDPLEQIKNFFEHIFDMVKTSQTYWNNVVKLWFQKDIVVRYHDKFEELQGELYENILPIIQQLSNKNPRLEFLFLAALLDGVLVHYIHAGDEYPIDEMKEMLFEKLNKLYKDGI